MDLYKVVLYVDAGSEHNVYLLLKRGFWDLGGEIIAIWSYNFIKFYNIWFVFQYASFEAKDNILSFIKLIGFILCGYSVLSFVIFNIGLVYLGHSTVRV